MRFSFFSLLDVYDTEARTSTAIYQQTLKQIVLADELGFDSYWIGEHHGYLTPAQQPVPRHWFSAIKADSFATRGRAAQPIISLPHLSAKSFADVQRLVEDHCSHYLAAGGSSEHYELPLILYTFVAPTRAEALHTAVDALRRYMEQQHPGSHEHITHIIHHLKDQKLLWFGTPGDLVDLIEQFQASVDNRHFVFWSDFGGIQPELVLRSMQLIAQEVLPHFTVCAN